MPNPSLESVSIIIPAFREEQNIEAAIDNAVNVAVSLELDYEVIVVDDGSPDRTGEYVLFSNGLDIQQKLGSKNKGKGKKKKGSSP